MKIALISQREYHLSGLENVTGLEYKYYSYFEKNGFVLIPIPNSLSMLDDILENVKFTHIILSGGNDIDSSTYLQESLYVQDSSIIRDKIELRLLEVATQNNIPVLGICRGMQFINVFFGGKLIQSLQNQMLNSSHGPNTTHKVLVSNPEITEFLDSEVFTTNSFHSQGVNPLVKAQELDIFAIHPETQIIEGLHHPSYPIAGVQWHPERTGGSAKLDRFIIKSFRDLRLFWKKTNKK